MYLNITFLRIEVVLFFISFFYTFYYFIGNIFFSVSKIKNIIWIKNKNLEKNWAKELKIKTDENDHVENYEKDNLSYEEKLNIADLLKKSRVFIGSKDFEKAKNFLVEWLSIDKFNKNLNLELAKIYILEKEFLKAEYIYKDLLLVHKNDINIMKKLWELLAEQEKYDSSLEIFKKAYQTDKNDLEIINMLANLSYVTKDFEKSASIANTEVM